LNLFSRVLSPWAFSPVLFSYLLTTRDPELHRTGVTSWPAGSQTKRMVKGKRPKESQKEPPKESQQEHPKESPSVQTLPPKKKKEKTNAAHTALHSQPAHPHPIKDVPVSKGTQLTILQRSPPKEETKDNRKCKEKDEVSSQSSQETELDISLENKKGNKKKGQAKLAASLLRTNKRTKRKVP
jgi:hypothetical protein